MDIVAALIKHQTLFVEHLRQESAAILSADDGPPHSGTYSHETFKFGALSLATLYKLKHPENSLQGKTWLRDLSVQFIDPHLKQLDKSADQFKHYIQSVSEWPPYLIARVVALLGAEIDDKARADARKLISAWGAYAIAEPFGRTSPNHEAWRCLSLYRCGEVFGEETWQERSLFFLRQLCTLQTREGFWGEGRHHGPSMKYNSLMLSPLAWLYRLTREQWIGDAALRLAKFMATYSYPDGTTVGCFDGRQSTSPAFWAPVCPGLELIPEGATLNQRGIELWQKLGMLSHPRALGPSNWYTHFGCLSCADALSYYTEHASERSTAEPLALDARNATIENQSACFSGLMRRWDSWASAVSAQESDIPRDTPNRFRLERQSRLEVWHETAGLVLGGGHNMAGTAVPYANVHLATGADGETNFGEVKSSLGKPLDLYMPRTIQASNRDDACCLTLNFAHGSIDWSLRPRDNERFIITAQWNLVGATRLCLQLPLVVWRGAEASIDGGPVAAQPGALSGRAGKLEVQRLGSKVTLLLPSVGETRVRAGLEPLRTYGKLFPIEHFDSPYSILLASTQLDNPAAQGSATWEIHCTAARQEPALASSRESRGQNRGW